MIKCENLFYFDIETVSFYKSLNDLLEYEPEVFNAFSTKYSRRREWENMDINEAYIKNAALFPEYGKLVTISFAYFIKGSWHLSVKSIKDNNEKELIEWISKLFFKIDELGLKIAGYNIKGFDVPFLFKKMIKYGVKIPSSLNSFGKKPWEMNFVDFMDVWKGTSFANSSLQDVTAMLGIPSPKDDIMAKDVQRVFWEENDVSRIETYCKKDVKVLIDICQKMQKVF